MNNFNESSFKEANSFCEAKFKNIGIIFKFLEKFQDSITAVFPRSEFGFRDSCIKGLWYRVYCWVESVTKLNHSRDFQAFASANRSLFEISVDLALLHLDKTNSFGWKMYWWNLSEKLDGAEKLINYFLNQNIAVPDIYSEQKDFINREKSFIIHMRTQLWKTEKHPKRWSNNGSFFDELETVDEGLRKPVLELFGMPLTQYYRTEYKRMSWYIHSGVSSFWNLPPEIYPTLSSFLLNGCANFALISTHIVVKDFGLAEHLPNYYEQLEKIELIRLQTQLNAIEKDVNEEIENQTKQFDA
jgi:hypothetical protein